MPVFLIASWWVSCLVGMYGHATSKPDFKAMLSPVFLIVTIPMTDATMMMKAISLMSQTLMVLEVPETF